MATTGQVRSTRAREVVIVLAIALGMLGVAIFIVLPQLRQVKRDSTQNNLDWLQRNMATYYQRHGSYPTQAQGLDALVQDGLVETIPLDAWGNKFRYELSGESCRIVSFGFDGRPGGTGSDADQTVELPASRPESRPATPAR
jgi:general secretion pathway protein G